MTAFYHGKYIYGYGPDYSPENGPQANRIVTLDFEKPFKSPYYSVERDVTTILYTKAVALCLRQDSWMTLK